MALVSIDIPEGVTSVDGFSGCTGLLMVKLPRSTTFVGNFSGCTNLEYISIPSSVKSVSETFENCPKLTQVEWSNLNDDNRQRFPVLFKQVTERRRIEGKCLYCGGDFKIITKTCKLCGKKKDY